MTDFRQDRSDRFKKPLAERGNPHGGRGRRASQKIEEQFETQTGHPLGAHAAVGTSAERSGGGTRRSRTDPTGVQHTRKGQAESPRELTLNQPERKKKRGGR